MCRVECVGGYVAWVSVLSCGRRARLLCVRATFRRRYQGRPPLTYRVHPYDAAQGRGYELPLQGDIPAGRVSRGFHPGLVELACQAGIAESAPRRELQDAGSFAVVCLKVVPSGVT